MNRLLILTILVLTVRVSFGQNGSRTFHVDRDFWEGCETGQGKCDPLVFERNSIHDSSRVEMPCGGTFTTVYLRKSGNETPIKKIEIDHEHCPPVFDLTEMSDGEYNLYMLACGLGGQVKFILRTTGK